MLYQFLTVIRLLSLVQSIPFALRGDSPFSSFCQRVKIWGDLYVGLAILTLNRPNSKHRVGVMCKVSIRTNWPDGPYGLDASR
jgi:hypothetical protein